MGLFGKKKDKVLDWSENYRIPEKRTRKGSSSRSNSGSDVEYLGNLANSGSSNSSSDSEVTWDSDSSSSNREDFPDKKQKLAKRLLEMTNKMEDLSNQIYHLKQRVELLEKKLKIRFE